MLLIRAELRQSPIEGLGLFALEPLSAGMPIWRFQPGFDQLPLTSRWWTHEEID